jgi:hypothetical protein
MSSPSSCAAAAAAKFCPNCCNYLYLQTNQENPTKLENVCHNCGFHKECESFFETTSAPKKIDTTDLKHDLTFMRTRAIKCPNSACDSNEVLYLKKKPQEQYLLFVCCTCSKPFKHTAVAAAAAGQDEDGGDDDGGDDDGGDDQDEEYNDVVDDDQDEEYNVDDGAGAGAPMDEGDDEYTVAVNVPIDDDDDN